MTVHVFFEGSTEEKVIANVCPKNTTKMIRADGKDNINPRLRNTLGPLMGQVPIRCLVLRDLDVHDGETPERIVQSLSDALRRMFEKRDVQGVSPDLQPLFAHPNNVFVWESAQPDIRVALHIADYRWNSKFIKATIDDYILGLALEPNIATALAQKIAIDPDRLITKITEELPALLSQNGIQLVEAKDYVRLYAAVIKAHTSPSAFAERTLSHADGDTISRTFAPLLAAYEYLI